MPIQNKKYALFVHDLFLEIGHSNALIETIRNFPQGSIDELVVVSFSAGDLSTLFPKLNCRLRFVKVPFPKLYPMLIKVMFYHIWTFIYSRIFLQQYFKVGVGIAALDVDLVNIQFIHHQWDKLYFDLLRPSFGKMLYKKILFGYYNFVESRLFRSRKVKFLALSQFINDYCQSYFRVDAQQIKTIYSGINLDKFTPPRRDRGELIDILKQDYSQLDGLDMSKPIYLFVGAFERKGLAVVMKELEKIGDAQLIIIGKPESSGKFEFSSKICCFHVEFTKELPLFYGLADAFVFSSFYEPFGLVIIEAAAMGCELYVTRQDVGAVELLEDLEGIHIFNSSDEFILSRQQIISPEQRDKFRNARLERLQKYSWHITGTKLFNFITEK